MLKPPEFDNFRNICFLPYFPHHSSHPSPNPAPWIFGQQIILPHSPLCFFLTFQFLRKERSTTQSFGTQERNSLDSISMKVKCQLTKTHSSLGKWLQRPIQTCLYEATYLWTEQSLVPSTFLFIIFSKKYEDLCYFSCTNKSLGLGFKPDQLDKIKG